ncbi:MAG: protocatechuate 3,4-dioxygenase [Pseudomonadota bacterium]
MNSSADLKNSPPLTRRVVMIGAAASIGSKSMIGQAFAAGLTPRAAEGPFYPTPEMRFSDRDNDLVKIVGLVKSAGGEVITLKGQVQATDGTPREGYRVEIWQCDVNGKYLHSGDGQNVEYDDGFQGFGHDITGTQGGYSFRTIKPTQYPGRTPHIHVKVFDASGQEVLTTQFYIAGHSQNGRDSLFRRMTNAQKKDVSMVFENEGENSVTTINIIV